mmetsp:Transcript_137963/g.384810  ORF Transcript_137963/g.384810 Transcript_137963/m.384810 type:complete len:229 (-) Transcript_137963:1735-2421(-)
MARQVECVQRHLCTGLPHALRCNYADGFTRLCQALHELQLHAARKGLGILLRDAALGQLSLQEPLQLLFVPLRGGAKEVRRAQHRGGRVERLPSAARAQPPRGGLQVAPRGLVQLPVLRQQALQPLCGALQVAHALSFPCCYVGWCSSGVNEPPSAPQVHECLQFLVESPLDELSIRLQGLEVEEVGSTGDISTILSIQELHNGTVRVPHSEVIADLEALQVFDQTSL